MGNRQSFKVFAKRVRAHKSRVLVHVDLDDCLVAFRDGEGAEWWFQAGRAIAGAQEWSQKMHDRVNKALPRKLSKSDTRELFRVLKMRREYASKAAHFAWSEQVRAGLDTEVVLDPHAVTVLQQLQKDGHLLEVNTSRGVQSRERTERMLQRLDLMQYFERVHYRHADRTRKQDHLKRRLDETGLTHGYLIDDRQDYCDQVRGAMDVRLRAFQFQHKRTRTPKRYQIFTAFYVLMPN